MQEARQLIEVLHEMNRNGSATGDRRIARFTPALVGMIGTREMFDSLLSELDAALETGTISEKLRERANNLSRTFIPQVAGLNGITDLPVDTVSAADLRAIDCMLPVCRKNAVSLILAAMMRILKEASSIK